MSGARNLITLFIAICYMLTQKIKIQGLTCEACVKLSTFKLKKIAGVTEAKIDFKTGLTEILADRVIDFIEITQAFANTNYSVIKL